MMEGEALGFHLLEQANLTKSLKQMVLEACGKEKLKFDAVSQALKRIFENMGGEKEGEWLEGRGNTRREWNDKKSLFIQGEE